MTFKPDALLERKPLKVVQDYTKRDTILYALGVGAGNDGDPHDLGFVDERSLKALPTLPIVLAAPSFWLDDPEIGVDWHRLVNAGQELVVHAPVPVEGRAVTVLTIDALWDKGAEKGALLRSTRRVRSGEGELIATISQTHLLRGNGGFGGARPPDEPSQPDCPAREPDYVVDLRTELNQALIYRLSGDYNPLHLDARVASAAGFDRPILHGSCTYGIAGRAIVRAVCGNDPRRLRRLAVRFSRPVYPGETIRTEIWRNGPILQFQARVTEREVIVLSRGMAEISA